MNIRLLVAGIVLAGSVGIAGCSSDSDDGSGGSSSNGGEGGSGAEGAQGPGGAGPAGPGPGGAGPAGPGGGGPAGPGGAGPAGPGGAGPGGAGPGGAGGGGPVGCDDGGTRYADCDTCQNDELELGGCCEAELTACAGNPDCVSLNQCIQTCGGDDACIQGCAADFQGGIVDLTALADCLFGDDTPQNPGACGLACTATPGSCTDGGTDHASCEDCQDVEFAAGGCCVTEFDACAANAACIALNNCINACADDACVQTCFDDNPAGVNTFTTLITCGFGDDTGSVGACGTVCVGAAPSCSDGGPEFASCSDCQATETGLAGCCEGEADACFNSVQCNALLDCLDLCAPNDQACQGTCVQNNPAGANLLFPLSECLFGDGTIAIPGACGVACP